MSNFTNSSFSQTSVLVKTTAQSFFVRNANPTALITGQSKEISLTGAGFVGSVDVIINNTTIHAHFVTPTLVKFVLPYIPAGTYDIVVVNGNGNHWISRQILTITDPVGTHPDLGSAAKPMVLPPVQIEQSSTAIISPAVKYKNSNTSPIIYKDPVTTNMTAYTVADPSAVPNESVRLVKVQPNPSQSQLLNTPWGDFKNE